MLDKGKLGKSILSETSDRIKSFSNLYAPGCFVAFLGDVFLVSDSKALRNWDYLAPLVLDLFYELIHNNKSQQHKQQQHETIPLYNNKFAQPYLSEDRLGFLCASDK